ncbi:MAG TPA: phage tail tube protein [Actinomycetes bacterium]|nr:phage tail tube protein [Actinomycetes bacterium]
MPANTPTQAKIGYGTRLACEFTTGVYTDVAEVVTIGPPQPVADDVKVTNQDSPNRTHEYISGMIEAGEASMTLNWLPNDPTQDETTGLLALSISGATKNWRITTPHTPPLIWTFPGYVKAFKPAIPTEGAMTSEVTLKVTGASTFA